MASSTANVFAAQPAVTGTLKRAPVGTALPTDAWTAPVVAFKDQGYIGEDGFEQAEDRSTDKKKAFGGSVVKVLQTDYSVTIKFTFLESLNAEVLKSIYGTDNVTVDGDGQIIVKKNKKQSPHAAWVIDVFDGDALNRTTIANGQINNVDNIKKVHTDVISYTVTMECFEDVNGDNLLEYIAPTGEPVGP
ncbi:MAG: hypothetical protein LC723_13650 [Actinobacteria bacterium]|nr:hypothetical protein [Actinomycetota bacterium]